MIRYTHRYPLRSVVQRKILGPGWREGQTRVELDCGHHVFERPGGDKYRRPLRKRCRMCPLTE